MVATGIERGPENVAAAERQEAVGRPYADRRPYAERADPWAYIADVLGWSLTPQQERAIELVMETDRLLLPSANNVGKTFILAALAWYFYDAVASLPDPDRGLTEQGCILLLPGPDHNTIFDTIYSAMLEHAERAEDRGFPMPGRRSENRPYMRVGPRWFLRALAPARRTSRAVAHSASGRHHRNQVALIEEGAGVEDAVWEAAKGMCSATGNKIISSFNPTEPAGFAYEQGRTGAFQVLHLSALQHPNIIERRDVIHGAVSHQIFEQRVRYECDDRGPFPVAQPDPAHNDFVYALPPEDAPVDGVRDDEIPGAPDTPAHVFRPGPVFTAQGLGQWPTTSTSGLFDPGAWDQAVARWRAAEDPDSPADRVGVDAAREGNDDTCCAPAWGRSADVLLEAWREIQRATAGVKQKPLPEAPPLESDVERLADWLGSDAAREFLSSDEPEPQAVPMRVTADEALENVRGKHRVRIGRIVTAPKGTGPEVAAWIAHQFPDSPFNVDEGGVGASVYDHLNEVLERDAAPVAFGSSPLPRLPNEEICEDLRTQMFVRAAALMRLGLLDVPPDPMLRQEAMAHSLLHRQKSVKVDGVKKVRPTVRLVAKADVKKAIGRSPDRLEALVMSLLPLRIKGWDLT